MQPETVVNALLEYAAECFLALEYQYIRYAGLARGNGGGGVCAIPHYNGRRRLTIRESAAIQTFPDDFEFCGRMNACYRQIGNAVPVKFGKLLGKELRRLERAEP